MNSWMRMLLPRWGARLLLVSFLYLAAEAPVVWLQLQLHAELTDFGLRPSLIILQFAVAAYATYRIWAFHPGVRRKYHN